MRGRCRDRHIRNSFLNSSGGNWEYRLHLQGSVAMDALKPAVLGDTLRHLDELLDEARVLRERITAALYREREPFYPERRTHDEPHVQERRKGA